MREKLMHLIASKHELLINLNTSIPKLFQLTEHLIENGVTIPVRCKDCLGWSTEAVAKAYGAPRFCTFMGIPTDADDFCSHGERKDNG